MAMSIGRRTMDRTHPTKMAPPLASLLAEIQEWGQAHDLSEPDGSRKMRNLRPETAALVSLLVQYGRRTRLLEIGTSSGYSTIWLAWSLGATGGSVISIDHSAEKLAMADENLRRAGLRDRVELRQGDATLVARGLEGPFDFVFFDSVQVRPHRQLEILLPKLAPDALVLADNALSHAGEMAPFFALIDSQPDFRRVVIPVGKGLCIAHQQPI